MNLELCGDAAVLQLITSKELYLHAFVQDNRATLAGLSRTTIQSLTLVLTGDTLTR